MLSIMKLILDKWQLTKYTVFMDTDKNEISAKLFEQIEADYKRALEKRRYTIRRMRADNWTQKEIAEYWSLDVSRVNKIIKTMEEKGKSNEN
jgi:DNA-binding MarR family transcriptional regulator